MASNFDWKLFYASRELAQRKGEEIADAYDCVSAPVDVFKILAAERSLIHAVGEDFGNAFDGRIRFVGPRFLLCFNTKYDQWPHTGRHHSKVRFSIAHELGHFFLDKHRQCLVTNRQPHDSFVEFTAHSLVESEADHFACGLLMPASLLRKRVNAVNFPTISDMMDARRSFDVSLTGMLVRWAQLSDFPCATIATSGGRILFGWVSEAFRNLGCFRVRKSHLPECRYFERFVSANKPVQTYRQGEGSGSTDYWLDWDDKTVDTAEHYFAIPHSNQIWVHLTVDENELMDDRFD